jgi:hypothetical protein
LETPPALAVSVEVCAEVTDESVAENPAEEALADMVTLPGTLTAPLLLERLTFIPPVGAGPLSVTVQSSEPAPATDALAQDRSLNIAVLAVVPVPVRAITADGFVEELLVMVNCPDTAPVAEGSN